MNFNHPFLTLLYSLKRYDNVPLRSIKDEEKQFVIEDIPSAIVPNSSAENLTESISSDILHVGTRTAVASPTSAQTQTPLSTRDLDIQLDYQNHGTAEGLIIESKVCTRVTPLRKCLGELLLGESNVYFISKEVTYLSGITEASSSTARAKKHSHQLSFSYDLIREIHNRYNMFAR